METVDEQAEHKIVSIIETVDSDVKLVKNRENLGQIMGRIENLMLLYNISDKVKQKIYYCFANIYFVNSQYNNCRQMAFNLFNLANKLNDLEYVEKSLLAIIRSNYNSKNYIDALAYLEIYENSNKVADKFENIKKTIYYYGAITNKKMCNYIQCLKYLDMITSKFNISTNEYFDLKILQGVCLIGRKKINEAKLLFENILTEAKGDKNITALAYSNLAEVSMLEDDFHKCNYYIYKATNIEIDESYMTNILCSCVLFSIKTNNKIFVDTHYNKALECIYKSKDRDRDLEYEIISKVFNYYVENLFDTYLERFLNNIYNKILNRQVTNLKIGYIFYTAYDYFSMVDNYESDHILSMAKKVQRILLK